MISIPNLVKGLIGLETLKSILGFPAPNMSVIVEPASRNNDGAIWCNGSILNNRTDITFMPFKYPIQNYEKVDPFQVVYEGPLSIISTYKVEDNSFIYAGILEGSLNSFNIGIWSLVFVSIFTFVTLFAINSFFEETRILTHF